MVRRRLFIVTGVLVVAGALLFLIPVLLSSIAASILGPFFALQQWLTTSSSDFPQYWQERSELIAEINDLKRQVTERSAAQGTTKSLQADNDAFRAMLAATGTPRIAAVVTHGPSVLPYDTILIDQGRQRGVQVGAPVFYGTNQVIGVIQEVFEDHALATLITTSGFTTTVYVLGPDIYTTAEGLGGGVLRVAVPQGIPLAETDVLLLPTIAGGVVGEVSLVESIPTQPNQYGYITLPIPLKSLRYVSVATEPLTEIDFSVATTNVATTVAEYFTVSVPDNLLIAASSTASTTEESLEETL